MRKIFVLFDVMYFLLYINLNKNLYFIIIEGFKKKFLMVLNEL